MGKIARLPSDLANQIAAGDLAVETDAYYQAIGAPATLDGFITQYTLGSGETLVRYYNAGRVAMIGRLWAPAPRFQWFSTGPPGARLGQRAYNRATLLGYFRSRVRCHERLRLTQLGAGYDSTRGIVNFGGKLVRSGDDIRTRPSQDFKGAADCLSSRPLLIVWSM